MTRIITDGAEMGDVLFWVNPDGYCNADSGTKRSGNYSYRISSDGHYFLTGDLSAFYFRFAVRLSNTNCVLFSFRHSTTTLADIYLNYSAGKISARVNGVTVGTSTSSFTTGQWYLIESYYNISDTGDFKMRFEGIEEITYAGDTKPGSDTHIDRITTGVNTNYNFYFDDIAVNDTNGEVDNSWCGDGRIVKLTPSGSGTENLWLNSGSVSGSANYLYVDEYPNDGDTTYVYASASSTGFQDQYALSNFLESPRVDILRIWAETRAKVATTGSDVIKLGYLPSGGTEQLSGSIALTTNYAKCVGTSASANPATSLPWTIDDINGLEYVIEVG